MRCSLAVAFIFAFFNSLFPLIENHSFASRFCPRLGGLARAYGLLFYVTRAILLLS